MAQDGLLGTGIQSRSRKVRRSARRAVARQPAAPTPRIVRAPAKFAPVVRQVATRASKPVKKELAKQKHAQNRQQLAENRANSATFVLPLVREVQKERLRQKLSPEGWAKTLPGYSAVLGGAKKSYAGYVRGLYGRAHKFYPGAPDKPPPIDFNTPRADDKLMAYLKSDLAHEPPGNRPIHFTAKDALGFIAPRKPARVTQLYDFNMKPLKKVRKRDQTADFVRYAPVHEFAHEFQRGPYNRARDEGGAEAFARQVASALGVHPVSSPEYTELARHVRRKKGRGYVTSGQFGYPYIRHGHLYKP